ncbi:hypothetical protein BJV78DRAFT_1280197 [Lactifluus subvellereus]|nr:hypothetical protein BJV78DRAFT_1280197 [Lactifluus subvellereus]
MSASSQFLTVPPLSHRSSQHTRSDRERSATQSPPTRHPTTGHVASSSKVKLEDTPLGTLVPTPPSKPGPAHPPPSSPSHHPTSPPTPHPVHKHKPTPLMAPSPSSPPQTLPPPTVPSGPPGGPQQQQQSPPLSPRSILRMVPLLLRFLSPPSDLFHLSCSSGDPRTHAAVSRSLSHKLPLTLTYTKTFVCADAVNAEVLLRFARIDLFERAQQANRHVTALVDEEWRYDIRQTKNGDYNVQARSAASQT